MATLHAVTENTKQLLKWGSIAVGSIIVIVLLFQGGIFLKNTFFPTPRPAPQTLFGRLAPISFAQPGPNAKKHTFAIDTVSGKLPVFIDDEKKLRDRMAVYRITHNELSLLDLQNTRTRAAKAGFIGQGIPIRQNVYRFQKTDSITKTLDVNIINKNFTLTSAYPTNEQVLAANNLPDQATAVETTTTFLRDLGVFASDIDEKKTKAQILSLRNGILADAERFENAQIIRVDFFQKNQGLFPIYYPKGIYSTMYFLVASGTRSDGNIVLGDFYHQTISEKSATYPIKSVAAAYQELQEGKAYTAADFTTENQVKIKGIFLGYYLSDSEQDFLMPIYIFKGEEDEFYAYVSAVADSWIATSASPSPSE